MTRIVLVIVSLTLLIGLGTVAAAEDVGNKFCPVSGEKIVESMKATYEHDGKIYNFCCPMCIDDFKRNPEKYAAKAEQEVSGEHSAHEAEEGHSHHH